MRRAAVAAVLLLVSAFPATARADHVALTGELSARIDRLAGNSAQVVVEFAITCVGVARANYFGNLYLVDQSTGSRSHYLGGIAGRAGTGRASIALRPAQTQTFVPLMVVSCSEDRPPFHGSGDYEITGPAFTVPALGTAAAPTTPAGPGAALTPTTSSTTSSTTTPSTPPDTSPPTRTPGVVGPEDPPTVDDPGPGQPPAELPAGACAVERRGTPANDVLTGTSGDDYLVGLGGDDRLLGRSGHDCLYGGPGRDRLEGEGGDDALYGGDGDDVLVGGTGTNIYDAGAGNDQVTAANGRAETVSCGPGNDRVRADRRDRLSGCERVTRV